MDVKFFYGIAAACMLAFSVKAQDFSGQWEGELTRPGAGRQKLKVRMELVQQRTDLLGLIYTRGYDKGVSFGCDFFVTGNASKQGIQLRWKNIQRDFNTGNACGNFRELQLRRETHGADVFLNGGWELNDEEALLRLVRTDSVISPIAEDEINTYLKELYSLYDSLNVALDPAERLIEKIIEQPVNSKELILDFSAADSTGMDSIHVVLNGNLLINAHDFNQKSLRIRLPVQEESDIDFLIISLSQRFSPMNLRVVIRDGEEFKTIDCKPSRVRNARLFFYRNPMP